MPHSVEAAQQPELFVNDGPLEDFTLLKPSHADETIEDLRRKYNEDGYVWLKGLIPREDVLKARRDYFDYMSPSGVLKPGSTSEQGIFDSSKSFDEFPGIGAGAAGANGKPGGEKAEVFVNRALEAHKENWYKETFCKHPALLDFVKKFSGWGDDTLALQRSLLRNNIPGTLAIGCHFDQIFLRHGEPTSITAWVPIGDIKINGGGLIYLEQGHNLGREMEEEFSREAVASGMSESEAKSAFNSNMMDTGLLDNAPAAYGRRFNRRWLVAEYEAGDVVLHTPFTIHASTINHDPDGVIRLATDLRFVNSSKPWDKRWNKVYEVGDGV